MSVGAAGLYVSPRAGRPAPGNAWEGADPSQPGSPCLYGNFPKAFYLRNSLSTCVMPPLISGPCWACAVNLMFSLCCKPHMAWPSWSVTRLLPAFLSHAGLQALSAYASHSRLGTQGAPCAGPSA